MYWLGPFEYKSKKALLDALKSYLQTAPAGVITNRYAIKKLHLLIAMHPDAERKIGVGVDHFKIKRNVLGAGNGFWLVRSDGSEDSFSYERCITGVVQSPHGKVCEALRFVVRPQMHAFRDALGLPVQCSVTGVDIVKRKDLHIDHKDPFWLLLERFCQDRQVDLSVLETRGNGETLELVDKRVASAFEAFHRLHAELRPVLKDVNVAKGGRVAFRL
ncbi:DCL family protein [Pseudomonas gingeri]|uniref:DCL family protein n=1 Tax=Pseudomonas gingeri TaxID=117681 RepID=A0A7Y8BNG3_9PSED|nr:DCL family protein [Pseudomonas gingeri]NWB50145.1 DCL family protein [Pseudomonas gingeri]